MHKIVLKMNPLTLMLQVAGKILNNKVLEFYKWDGELKQILQNLRDKINKITLVLLRPLPLIAFSVVSLGSQSVFLPAVTKTLSFGVT